MLLSTGISPQSCRQSLIHGAHQIQRPGNSSGPCIPFRGRPQQAVDQRRWRTPSLRLGSEGDCYNHESEGNMVVDNCIRLPIQEGCLILASLVLRHPLRSSHHQPALHVRPARSAQVQGGGSGDLQQVLASMLACCCRASTALWGVGRAPARRTTFGLGPKGQV